MSRMPDFPNMIDRYVWQACEEVAAMERTEAIYDTVVKAHIAQLPGSRIIAEQRAATHPDVQQAIADGAWHRSKAQTYALGAIALMLHEQRQEEKR